MNQNATVADFSPRMAALEDERALVRTIMGGTESMRKAKQKYLPQHPAEGDEVYKTRLNKTFLDNFVALGIDKAKGKIFAKPIHLDNLPPELEEICENIDRQGRDLHSFMWDVAATAFEDGISYVLADKPAVEGALTVADAKAKGIRPYAVHLKPECLLEARHEMIDGVETITLLRWMECVNEQDGDWGSIETTQIHVLRRVQTETGASIRWEIYRQSEDSKKEWTLWKEGPTSFSQIYLVPFYTNRCGFLEGRPPFQRIAEANLEHWQVKSEEAHALSMNCFGMYTATGVDVEEGKPAMVVGPGKCLVSGNPDAKYGVLETTGVGVTLSANKLKAIESRIETAGVNLRVENAGKVTATAAALDSADTDSGLKAIAEGFSDSLEQLLGYFCEMLGIDVPKDMDADFNDDFGQAHGSQQGLASLDKARALGDISREGWFKVMQWRGEIPADFDVEKDKEHLDEEGPALGTMGQAAQPVDNGQE